jgi:plastocyanin
VGAGVLAAVLIAGCQMIGAEARGTPSTPAASAPSAPAVASSPSPSTATDPGSSAITSGIDPRTDGLDVTFGEFAITLEAAVIRPGHVTLVVHNGGQLTHGFEMKIESGRGSDRDRMEIQTRTFHSGETLRVEADLPPGTYEIECFVADHDERGMRTTLEVRADAPLVSAAPDGPLHGVARIVQFAFVPASIDVAAGSEITWRNEDPTPHTVTADGGAFDSHQLDAGASYSAVLQNPGDYPFHCDIHPTMTGTIHVQ